MANKKNRKKNKEKELQIRRKQQKRFISYSLILCGLIFLFSLVIYEFRSSVQLKTSINEVTANYISFNNSRSTDMLKISNLKKYDNRYGKGIFNKKKLEFVVQGNNGDNYELILFQLGNKIDEEYVKYQLTSDDIIVSTGKVNELETREDGGKVLYSGKVDGNKIKLNMWLSKDYEGNNKNVSYEVKVKSR